MAQPIPLRLPQHNGAGYGEHHGDGTRKRAEAISSALELLQLLHDRGVLDLLRGAVAAGDQLMDILATAAATPDSVRALRNLIRLTKFIANIPPEFLNNLTNTVMESAERAKTQPAPSLLQLLLRLRSENSRRTAGFTLDLLERLGKVQ
jgi:uncharacterized protein YjgD (DUF1641 family)